jgi:hypothetical protein
MKSFILRKFPLSTEYFNSKWWTDLLASVEKLFLERCNKDGGQLADTSPPMSEEDFILLCKTLLFANDRKSIADRALIVLDWQAIGRVSEIFNIKSTDFSLKESHGIETMEVSSH